MSMTNRVLHRNKKSPPSRYSPYTTPGTKEKQEKQKKEAVRLGVELSLFVAETMFLLSDDDIRSTLRFCHWLLNYVGNKRVNGPVVGRVFVVIEYVLETYIKPKNGVYKDRGQSINMVLTGTFQHNFTHGVRGMTHIVSILKNGGLAKPSGLEQYEQELKMLEEKLKPVKDVSDANGFAIAREAIESYILQLWESLFETTTTQVMDPMIRYREMFRPLWIQVKKEECSRRLASLQLM